MLCEQVYTLLDSKINKWALHRCDVKGCAEGYVTVDGNEKLRRPMCAAPHSRIQVRPDLPTINCSVLY